MTHPQRLGKYDITGVLGEGAMGVVYKAHDPGINRPVAIKTIRKALTGGDHASANLPARFRNEAQAVGRLSHPGIVAIYEYGEDETTSFIAMEFVEGRDLAKILAVTPMLPEPMVRRFMHQLLDALDCAHRHGVWHRDIKPANLIITATGQLKITDFGVARIESVPITQVAAAIGTPGYMAPEQYIGEAIDHRVDIFAAGVVLYRLLSGQPPFTGSAETVMYKILNKDPMPVSQLPPGGISPLYDPIIARALAKDPKARFESAAQFRDVLSNRAAGPSARSAADDTTIIMPLQRIGHLDDPAPWALGTGATRPDAPSGWDTATLAPLENALTRFMGPLAKVLVRQAARSTADLRALQQALAQQIPDAADRAKFTALIAADAKATTEATRAGHAGEPSASGSHPTLAATQTGGTEAITPEVQEHARLVLARHVGPIAKIVLKKALAGAGTPEQLFAALVHQIGDQTDRVRLLEDLRRKPRQ